MMNYIRNKIVNSLIDVCSYEMKSYCQLRNEICSCKAIVINSDLPLKVGVTEKFFSVKL